MQAWRDVRGYGFGGQDCAERQTSGERLGNENDVGLRGKFLVSEVAPGAAEAALNLVGNKQSAVLRGEGAGAIPEGFCNGGDSALALGGLGGLGGHGGCEFGFEIGEGGENNEF